MVMSFQFSPPRFKVSPKSALRCAIFIIFLENVAHVWVKERGRWHCKHLVPAQASWLSNSVPFSSVFPSNCTYRHRDSMRQSNIPSPFNLIYLLAGDTHFKEPITYLIKSIINLTQEYLRKQCKCLQRSPCLT